MKAISLWQPYASLCVMGLKTYETRSWSTPYRGDLVIHAAKRSLTNDDYEMIEEWESLDFVDDLAWELNHAPFLFGAALGIVTITAVYRTEELMPKISPQERAFGNYDAGRYAWRIENPRPFPRPIPYRGKQGLWTWDLPVPEGMVKP